MDSGNASLARALITAPELLILDDTTSAVDAGTEAEINAALGRYADDQHMLLVIAAAGQRCGWPVELWCWIKGKWWTSAAG